MYLQNYGLRMTWLDKCLKSLVSEDHLTGNVVNGSKHCFNASPYSLITVKVIQLERFSLSDMENLKTFC